MTPRYLAVGEPVVLQLKNAKVYGRIIFKSTELGGYAFSYDVCSPEGLVYQRIHPRSVRSLNYDSTPGEHAEFDRREKGATLAYRRVFKTQERNAA